MPLLKFAAALLLAVAAAAAGPPPPELRIEPATGGSVFYVKNVYTQPLTAYVIELVDYPGSSFYFWKDDVPGDAIPPGVEKRIPVSNMTVGAAPEYVKVQAAIYADGTSTGVADRIAALLDRRRSRLEITRELIRRLEAAQSAGTGKAALITDLKQWADSMQPTRKAALAAMKEAAGRQLIMNTAARLDTKSLDDVLAGLRASERALAASDR
jgi:hypothetical protein